MNYSIAEFYINEQEEWKDSIEFYLEYIDETEEWLNEITRYDTVIHLAAKVEHHLNQLQVSKLDFFRQQSGIEVLKKQLLLKNLPLENEQISAGIHQQQKTLRENMHSLEKTFLDTKYSCNEFLASTLQEQKEKNKNSDA